MSGCLEHSSGYTLFSMSSAFRSSVHEGQLHVKKCAFILINDININ